MPHEHSSPFSAYLWNALERCVFIKNEYGRRASDVLMYKDLAHGSGRVRCDNNDGRTLPGRRILLKQCGDQAADSGAGAGAGEGAGFVEGG
jgi:hypothetical protein